MNRCDRHQASEDGKASLRTAVQKQADRFNWHVDHDVGTSFAPLHDFVKPNEKANATNGVNCGIDSLNRLVRSQKGERMKALVDMLLTSGSARMFCLGIHEPSSASEVWSFSNPVPHERLPVFSKEFSTSAEDCILRIPQSNGLGSWSISIRQNALFRNTNIYSQGMSSGTNDAGYDSVIFNVSGILLGTFGFIMCSLLRQLVLGKGRDVQRFIPTILTPAKITSCEYDQHGSPTYTPKHAVLYDCPIPAAARFPNQIAGADTHMSRTVRWPVLVTDLMGLADILYRSRSPRSPYLEPDRSTDDELVLEHYLASVTN